MRILISLLIFYKKLVVPSLVVAMALGFPEWQKTEVFPIGTVVISYILLSLAFHYLIYEKRNSNEYYFYYNMGLSKLVLWGASLFVSSFIGLIVVTLWVICK